MARKKNAEDKPAISGAEPVEIDELGELEELPEEGPPASPLLQTQCVRNLVNSYGKIPIPIAILDKSLSFVFKNGNFEDFLRNFEYADSDSFLQTIGRSIDREKAQDLYTKLKDGRHGFTWRGTMNHRSRDAGTAITKVQIIPFSPADEAEDARPVAYSVFFDDVTEESKRFLHGHFSSLLETSKLKDNDTGKHIERVNLYSKRMALAMYRDERWPEVDVDFIENIGFLAAMHDVGKIGTPDVILNKKGPLNEFEWGIMKEHTINGAFILSNYPNPMAKQIAQSHHERWDGGGYPFNLVGPMIPLPARIVSIADVYDALRMKRSYKAPFSHAEATARILADRDSHFDPEIVHVFASLAKDFETVYRENDDR